MCAAQDSTQLKLRDQKKFKIVNIPPSEESLVVINNKIYNRSKVKDYSPFSLLLIGKIIDSTSTCGIKYIYIYKTK
jgi:hypothetical protein